MEGISGTRRCNFQGVDLFGGDDAAFNEFVAIAINPWICVEGYNTSLPRTKIKELLTNHFGSCGLLDEIYFPSDSNSCAYLHIFGKGAASNAIKLSGSMMEGQKIVAQAKKLPLPEVKGYIFGSGSTVPAEKVDMMEIDT